MVIANVDLAFIYPLKCLKKKEEEDEEDIFQTRDSKAISKEESSLKVLSL